MKSIGLLLVAVFLLFSMGILMVFNTTAAEVLDRSLDRSTHQAFLKQMVYAGIAIPLFWIIGKIPSLAKNKIVHHLTTANNLILFSLAWLLMFFGLFEGIVQAFVITMLTVTFLSLVTRENEEANEQEGQVEKEIHANA